MTTLDKVTLDISVVLGRCRIPVHQMLRMGRGAVIELDTSEYDLVEIQANNLTVARGKVVVQANRIAIEVIELVRRPEVETLERSEPLAA
ncbi:MAG: flagellar motor switch protein FliN [Beijerinckiaceae bacterium]|nr:flagellar motor switch protein FliN [Beijerinckiaceae bacterium]